MNDENSLDRILFWTFCSNFLFVFGMTGYLVMDTFDLIHSQSRLTVEIVVNSLYVFLASLFVMNAALNLFIVYSIDRQVKRYSLMISSSLFDQFGSYAYFIGALLATNTIEFVPDNVAWSFNAVGVCTFLIAATINLFISQTKRTAVFADHLNFLGSFFYLLAIVITRLSWTKILIIVGDVFYLVCAILYMICWSRDRKIRYQQYMLIKQ